jgi:molybdate transport repressor ModE-like protein
MHRMVWGDLQYLLAVARGGSLAAAARALGVNHTTVLRRMTAFEDALGVRVFERRPSGYVLTRAGEELVAAAGQMQDVADAVERKLAGRDLQLTGTVRVTTTDTLAVSLVPDILARFTAAHPEVALELTTTTAMVSLTKRDADLAVRPTSQPPQHLVGRRVGRIAFAVYASAAYLARNPARRDLAKHAWLAPDDGLAATTIARWIARELPGLAPVLRADTLTALAHAAVAGHGVAALPCYLGDTLALERVRGVIAEMDTQLWVLTHPDLRDAARIRALTEWLADELAAHRALLEGRGVSGPAASASRRSGA